MSRPGECLDKAVAERFCGRVKGERTALRHDATRQEAREDVVESIEMFSNSKRWPSYVGYVSPHDFESLGRGASLNVRFYLTITGRVFTHAEVRVLLEHGRGIKVWAPLDSEMLA
jgi:hypothetical protein